MKSTVEYDVTRHFLQNRTKQARFSAFSSLVHIPVMFGLASRASRSSFGLGLTVAALATFSTTAAAAAAEPKVAFSPKEWRQFSIESVQTLSHDTKLFRVRLPSKDHGTRHVLGPIKRC
jgi:hypothetical protein